jgi:uncharacterized protein YbjT (DUF2867 family)
MATCRIYFGSGTRSKRVTTCSRPGHGGGYLDVRDIAYVAVAVAKGSFDGKVLDLTGPEAVTGAQVAAVLSEVLRRPVMFVSPDLERFRAGLIQNGLPRWRVDALVEAILGGRGSHLSAVSSDVEVVTGRPPRTLRQFRRGCLRLAFCIITRQVWNLAIPCRAH